MDHICDSNLFTDHQVRQINACRLYLQVALLSDITMPRGDKVNPAYFKMAISLIA